MVDFLASYGLFLAKALTVVGAFILVIVAVGAVASRNKKDSKEGYLSIHSMNETLEDMEHALKAISVPRSLQCAADFLSEKAQGAGIPGITVDAMANVYWKPSEFQIQAV